MIIDDVALIHSVDSLRLAREIDKEASVRTLIKNCLLQIHIASEDTKQGFTEKEIFESISEIKCLRNIRICGLMGMASFVEDQQRIANEFSYLKGVFMKLKERYYKDCDHFKEISMGMSSDYKLAIEEGSTMVRIGSKIFGER